MVLSGGCFQNRLLTALAVPRRREERERYIEEVKVAVRRRLSRIGLKADVRGRPKHFYSIHRKRLEIYSTEPRRDIDMRRLYQESIQLVLDGLVNTREMITHRVPLSEIGRAFALRTDETGDAIHVLIDCEQ